MAPQLRKYAPPGTQLGDDTWMETENLVRQAFQQKMAEVRAAAGFGQGMTIHNQTPWARAKPNTLEGTAVSFGEHGRAYLSRRVQGSLVKAELTLGWLAEAYPYLVNTVDRLVVHFQEDGVMFVDVETGQLYERNGRPTVPCVQGQLFPFGVSMAMQNLERIWQAERQELADQGGEQEEQAQIQQEGGASARTRRTRRRRT